MEIIGTRSNSAFRAPADYFLQKPAFAVGVDPTTGGPVRLVEDRADHQEPREDGQVWVIDIDPDSNTYRRPVLVPPTHPRARLGADPTPDPNQSVVDALNRINSTLGGITPAPPSAE